MFLIILKLLKQVVRPYSKEEKEQFLLDNSTLPDCSFAIGNLEDNQIREVFSYKSILADVSPVFERMFKGNYKEKESSFKIAIDDIEYSIFQSFVDDIHDVKSHENCSLLLLRKLIVLSDRYDIPTLEKFYKTVINKRSERFEYTSAEDVLCLVKYNKEFELDTFPNKFMANLQDVLTGNINQCIIDNTLKSKLFYELTLNELKELFLIYKRTKKVSEIQLYTIIQVYADAFMLKNDISIALCRFKFKCILNLIDWERMTGKEFLKGPAKSELLSLEEKYVWVSYFLSLTISQY